MCLIYLQTPKRRKRPLTIDSCPHSLTLEVWIRSDYFAAELRPTLLTSNDIPLDLLSEYIASPMPHALAEFACAVVGVCPAPERKDVRWDSGHFERLVHVHEKKTDTSDIMPPFASWQLEKMRNAILPGTVQKLSLNLKKHSNIIRRVFFLQVRSRGSHFLGP